MTPLAEILAARIRRDGPIAFSDFMDAALYHPEHGYYRSPRDPFGIHGDFFTASQLQPVFGRLIAAAIASLRARLGHPDSFTVADWGAGRAELAPFLSHFHYLPIDAGTLDHPTPFAGAVFANELFDALPVDIASIRGTDARLMRVSFHNGAFTWLPSEPVSDEWRLYLDPLAARFEDRSGLLIELPVRLRPTLHRMAASLHSGAIIAIDYGYTAREIIRFPRGTLMSYHRHQAFDDVLRDPGLQDITAHVPFTHLQDCAAALGLHCEPLENMARFLLRAGESDQFASALAAPDEPAAAQLRLQLKTLLFGMGETFRVLTLTR
jgi:SAM-dependent MidA family methyltransferase